MHARVPLPDATMMIIDILSKEVPLSISALAKSTGLDRRTVAKAVDMILKIQNAMQPFRLEMNKVGNTYVVWLKDMTAEMLKLIDLATKKLGIKRRTE